MRSHRSRNPGVVRDQTAPNRIAPRLLQQLQPVLPLRCSGTATPSAPASPCTHTPLIFIDSPLIENPFAGSKTKLRTPIGVSQRSTSASSLFTSVTTRYILGWAGDQSLGRTTVPLSLDRCRSPRFHRQAPCSVATTAPASSTMREVTVSFVAAFPAFSTVVSNRTSSPPRRTHLRRRHKYAIGRQVHRIGNRHKHIAINPRPVIPSRIRVLLMIHPHRDHVWLAKLHRPRQIARETTLYPY